MCINNCIHHIQCVNVQLRMVCVVATQWPTQPWYGRLLQMLVADSGPQSSDQRLVISSVPPAPGTPSTPPPVEWWDTLTVITHYPQGHCVCDQS